MCLIPTNREGGLQLKVAMKDIVCYKLVYETEEPGRFRSEWKRAYYKASGRVRNIPREEEGKFQEYEGSCHASFGFHSYIKEETALIEAQLRHTEAEATVVKCIIPKGAHYYTGRDYGRDPCYCSNKIKIMEVLYG